MRTPADLKPRHVTVGQIIEAEQQKPPNYRWVLLWQAPLRTLHWLTALCVLTLILTGLYIGRPYFMTAPGPEAGFLMGWMRFIHFTAAGLLIAVGIFRVYVWLYGGNKFERLPAPCALWMLIDNDLTTSAALIDGVTVPTGQGSGQFATIPSAWLVPAQTHEGSDSEHNALPAPC